MRVLFVCSGNICRSPFAELVAREMNDRADTEFSSAGTNAIEGIRATSTGVAAAAELGLDMEPHRATQLRADLVAASDLVYVMESHHADSVLALDASASVDLLRADGLPIPDPYGGDRLEYRGCYSMIREALEQRLAAGGR